MMVFSYLRPMYEIGILCCCVIIMMELVIVLRFFPLPTVSVRRIEIKICTSMLCNCKLSTVDGRIEIKMWSST